MYVCMYVQDMFCGRGGVSGAVGEVGVGDHGPRHGGQQVQRLRRGEIVFMRQGCMYVCMYVCVLYMNG